MARAQRTEAAEPVPEEAPKQSFAERVGGGNRPFFSEYVGSGVELNGWNNPGAKGAYQNASLVHKYKDKEGNDQKQTISLPIETMASLAIHAAELHKAWGQERKQQRSQDALVLASMIFMGVAPAAPFLYAWQANSSSCSTLTSMYSIS